MKFGLAFFFLSFLGYDNISEGHSGSNVELFGKLLLSNVMGGIFGFVMGLPVGLFISIIRKIPFFDSWRRGWVRLFRSKK